MTPFKVFFEIDGERKSMVVHAANPQEAAVSVRKANPGAFVTKTKLCKEQIDG